MTPIYHAFQFLLIYISAEYGQPKLKYDFSERHLIFLGSFCELNSQGKYFSSSGHLIKPWYMVEREIAQNDSNLPRIFQFLIIYISAVNGMSKLKFMIFLKGN